MWFLLTWSLCLQLCFCSNPSNSASDFAWIMWGLFTRAQDASCPRCGLSTWKQGAIVTGSCQKYNLQLFPSDCAESKSYHPSAPPEQHWLMAVPWCAQVQQREPGKSHWREKDMVNQISVTARWSCKHPAQDKEAEINENSSTSIITEACKCAHYTHTYLSSQHTHV